MEQYERNDSASSATHTQSSTESVPAHLPEAWVAKLQARLTAIYGQKFTSFLPDQSATLEWRETWAIALRDMTGEQIAVGLDKLMKGAHEWPPTTGEFRALCKPVIRPEHQRHPVLAAPRDTKDRGPQLAALKAMLTKKMTGKPTEKDDAETA